MPESPGRPRRGREPRRRRPSLMSAALEKLRGLSVLAVVAAALVLTGGLGAIDYVAEQDLSFLVFYLIPVFLVTLRAGLWPGLLTSLAGTAVWFIANVNLFRQEPGEFIPFWNFAETLGVFAFFTYVLSSLVDALDEERQMSRYDARTGIVNRRHFLELLEGEIGRSRRFRRPFTLAYMDLDSLRTVNELRGRSAGDALLSRLGELLLRETGDADTPARLGGDEFAVLMPETGYEAAHAALGTLRGRIGAMLAENGCAVTVTMAAVTSTNPAHSAEEMIGMADRLMYAKKAEGKGGIAHRVADGPGAPPAPA